MLRLTLSLIALSSLSAYADTSSAPASVVVPQTSVTEGNVVTEVETVDPTRAAGVRLVAAYNAGRNGRFTENETGANWNDRFVSGPGVAVDYTLLRLGKIGFSAGAGYDFRRRMKDSQVTTRSGAESAMLETAEMSIAAFRPYANANIGLTELKSYLFGGINFSVPQYRSNLGDSMTGEAGAQFGMGFLPTKKVHLELMYQRANFNYTYADNRTSNYAMGGLMFRLGYQL